MSDNNYQEVIKNNKLFDGIPPRNLKFSFSSEQILRRKEGEIIFQKGDESRNTYLIVAGRVKIKVYIENKSVKLNKTINDFFGEIEVLEDTYRRSAAVANTDCILYVLSNSDLRAFLADYPEINDNIIAYNKVEIPELQITINPGLLKQDTDKLYVTPPPENKTEEDQPDGRAEQESDELEDKRREIEKTAEMIFEISGGEDEYSEDELAEDKLIEAEAPDEDTPDDLTARQKLSSADETAIEKRTESENASEPEPATENLPLAEEEQPFTSEDTPIPETTDESTDKEDITESEKPAEEVYEFQAENENVPDESVESANEVTGEFQKEALEENELTDQLSETNSFEHETDQEDGTKWINLNLE